MLSLAAGTVPDADPIEVIEAAAAAGFDACGLRLAPGAMPARTVRAIAAALASTGIELLDVEVIRMYPGDAASAHRRLIDLAAELGARWLLTVSHIPDHQERFARFSELAELAATAGVGVSLEFMGFTQVRTLAEASELVRAVPGSRILVDALHLARTGGSAGEVAAHRELIAFAQMCDAPSIAPHSDPAGLADEARHHRLFPGTGELDLTGLLAALPPDAPLSVEVQSDRLVASSTVLQRADAAMRAVRTLVARGR